MKKWICLVLSLAMIFSCIGFVSAATSDETAKANALYRIDLFRGISDTTVDFALDKTLNRAEGVVMLVRMLGAEKTALAGSWSHPFTDLIATSTNWAEKYIGYAYEKGLTKGTSIERGTFSGRDSLTDQQFATMCLRAMDYSDDSGDFTWDDSTAFAAQRGILASGAKNAAFDRGNAVLMIWSFLNGKLKNSTSTLSSRLISAGVFTAAAFADAAKIASGAVSGGTSGGSSSGGGSSRPGGGSSSGGSSTSDEEEAGPPSEPGYSEVPSTETPVIPLPEPEETEPEISLPQTYEAYEKLSNNQKRILSEALGDEAYAALIERLIRAERQGATEIGSEEINLDRVAPQS